MDGADRGRTGGLRRAGGQKADRRTGGRGAKERRTGGWHIEWRRTSGRADERMRADGARTGRISEQADGQTNRGFKRSHTLFPTSLSHAQTTRLTAERVCKALGSALGSQPGLRYFFLAPNNIFAI